MSNKVTSVSVFKNKSSRIIAIPGYEPGEVLYVRIKPASLMGMMARGKLPNKLLDIVEKSFTNSSSNKAKDTADLLKDTESLQLLTDLMRRVAQETLVEPTYEEIGEYLTDEQVQKIFEEAQGGVEAVIPSIQDK